MKILKQKEKSSRNHKYFKEKGGKKGDKDKDKDKKG